MMTEFCMGLDLLPQASLWQGYQESNWMGRGIVLLQVAGSVVVWCVMIGKSQELRATEFLTKRFRQVFDAAQGVLDIYFQRGKNANPLEAIYTRACDRLVKLFDPEARQALQARRDTGAPPNRALLARELELVHGTSEQELAEQAMRLERGMSMLATATTAAPLVGLLGTVWGVLDAFQAMSNKGSALLTDVAPGISSAMVTTVVGLLVAIPSAIGYNVLHNRIRRLHIQMEGFVDELLGRLACEFQGREL